MPTITAANSTAPFFVSLMLDNYQPLLPRRLAATTFAAAAAEARTIARVTSRCIAFSMMATSICGKVCYVHSH